MKRAPNVANNFVITMHPMMYKMTFPMVPKKNILSNKHLSTKYEKLGFISIY